MGFKKNILAFFIIGIAGTLGHFIYEWSGNNTFLGFIFPVNESTWEHLKLLFFPSIIYFIIEYIISNKKHKNYLTSAISGIYMGLLSIVVLFYTISGIIGKNVDFINISIYFISIIITICTRNRIINSGKVFSKKETNLLYSITIITAALFIIWSYNPPNLGLFISPV